AQNAVPLLTNTHIFRPTSAQAAVLAGLAAQGSTPVTCFAGQPQMPAATCAALLTSALTVSPTTGLSAGQAARNAFLNYQFENNCGLFAYNTREYFASGRFDHHLNEANQLSINYRFGH